MRSLSAALAISLTVSGVVLEVQTLVINLFAELALQCPSVSEVRISLSRCPVADGTE